MTEKICFLIAIIVIGEIILNTSVLFMIITEKKCKNKGVYNPILTGLLSSVVLNAGLIYLCKINDTLKTTLIVISVVCLFITLLLVYKKCVCDKISEKHLK